MKIHIGAKTDPGRRPNNEDHLLVVDVRRHGLRADGVLVVADGMGGRNFGERAAAAAVDNIGEALVELLQADHEPPIDVQDALREAMGKANTSVFELAGSDTQNQGMGTTCVVVVLENERLSVAHAGDSRAYLLRDNVLERLTEDHSYVAEQVRAGNLTEEAAQKSRFRNVITRAVGIESTIEPDISQYEVQPGDSLLLCTDGLTNMVTEEEIAQTMLQAVSAQSAADRLIILANRYGGRDNITAVIARMEVGNRTQRMRRDDLGHHRPIDITGELPEDEPENHLNGNVDRFKDEDEEDARDTPELRQHAVPISASPYKVQSGGSALRLVVGALILVVLLLLSACLTLGHVLNRDGYHLGSHYPFYIKPIPTPPAPPPDLASTVYDQPALLSVARLENSAIAIDSEDQSIVVLTVSGQELHISGDGQVLSKYPLLSRRNPIEDGQDLPPPVATADTHFATDTQGNLYVSDSQHHTLTRYRPNGKLIGSIAPGKLKHPEALAVADDGTIYIIDSQRLRAIRPVAPALP